MSVPSHLEVLHAENKDESVIWLSAIIQEVWPYAAGIAQGVMVECVEPALKSAFPKGIPTPRFKTIDLGTDGVVVKSVRVFERNYGHVDKDGNPESAVVIEADIHYDGNSHIEMMLGDFTFGVNDAKLDGRIEVMLCPIVGLIPMFAASQVAFINRPKIDYNLTGIAALGNQFLIRDILKKTVESVLGNMAVLPNRVSYKIIPDTDFFKFAAQPIGILRVAILSGSGFPATDRNAIKQAIGFSEEPDVYLRLRHGNKFFDTVHVDDSSDPVWSNQIFDFVLTTESPSQQLHIEAYDYDIGTDDFLGRASILVSDLVQKSHYEVNLEDSPEEARPTVKLAARWLALSSEMRHIQNAIISQRVENGRPMHCASILLTVDIDESHHLPAGKRPYVKVRIGDHHIFQTSAAYDVPGIFKVEDAEFEQSFYVPLDSKIDASAQIWYHVTDFYSGEILGYAFSSLSEAVEAGSKGKVYNFALLHTSEGGASLRVRVKLSAVLDSPPLWVVLAKSQGDDKKT